MYFSGLLEKVWGPWFAWNNSSW